MSYEKLQFIVTKIGGKHCVIISDHYISFEEGKIPHDDLLIDGTVLIQSYTDALTDVTFKYFFPGFAVHELVEALRRETKLLFWKRIGPDVGEHEYAVSSDSN